MKKFLLFVPFTGCIVVSDNEKQHQDDWERWDTGYYDNEKQDDSSELDEGNEEVENDDENTDLPPDDETPLEDHQGSFSLTPYAGPPGATFVTALRSSSPIDWYSIKEITAYGNIEICNMQPLYDEILLTITIPQDAQEAPVDFLVEYTDGDVDLIENAFYIDNEADLLSAIVSADECE
jgi:hypothetical protein